jgi:hypothetical protein
MSGPTWHSLGQKRLLFHYFLSVQPICQYLYFSSSLTDGARCQVLLLQPSFLLLLPSTSTTELTLGEAAGDYAGSPPHLRSGGHSASSPEGGSGTGDKGGALRRDPRNPSSGHRLGSPVDVAPSSDEHLQRFSATVRILSTKPIHLRSPH